MRIKTGTLVFVVFITCFFCSRSFVPPVAGAVPGRPPVMLGTQVSVGYSNAAALQLNKASQQCSATLSKAGFIPPESFTNPIVLLEGQATQPSGRIRGSCCEYRFRNGSLTSISRFDLFEDKGPASPILRHLTNNVLTLKGRDAIGRAMAFLRTLGYDTNGIGQNYRIVVRYDLMDAHPVRNGGPNFPEDLHFFGELISRKKIHLFVEFTPKNPQALANLRESPDMRIEFLATTGELLHARLAESSVLNALRIRSPVRIAPIETPDFTPPAFLTATRKLAVPPPTISRDQVLWLLNEAWRDLQQKLGGRQPLCYLIYDNLNLPEATAEQITKLVRGLPWAGASHFWRNDLPFEPALMEQLSHDRRGIGLLAVCGKLQTQLEVMRDLPEIAIPQIGNKASEARFANDRERLSPSVSNLLSRIAPGNGLDHAIFLFQANPKFASRVVYGEIESRVRAWGQVFDSTGARPLRFVGDGVTYYKGSKLSNALVILHIGGSLPLRMDPASLLRRMPQRRLISREVTEPITDIAYSFGPHPMQELFEALGADLISFLYHLDRAEGFRIKSNTPDDWSVKGRPNIDGHEIISRGKLQGPDFARRLGTSILNEKNSFGGMSTCILAPHHAFRVWRGKETATLLICFDCNNLFIKHYDTVGKLAHDAVLDFGDNRDTLQALAKSAIPAPASSKKRGQ